jgi:hypothetical protein
MALLKLRQRASQTVNEQVTFKVIIVVAVNGNRYEQVW